MDFLDQRQDEIVTNLYGFFTEEIEQDPHRILAEIERELESLYVRYGNDWTGRGVVGDTTQEAMIAALEGVRAECRARIAAMFPEDQEAADK